MKRIFLFMLLFNILLVGCVNETDTTAEMDLTPFFSLETVESISETPQSSETVLPAPTPTPRYHEVQAGDTMSGIAFRYGLDLNTLIAANPEINPNIMIVGMQVLLPVAPVGGDSTFVGEVSVPVELSETQCYQERSGGSWCFLEVQNPNDVDAENVQVEIVMGDQNAQNLTAVVAATPLNVIPAGGSMPVAAFFNPPTPIPYRLSVQLISALPAENPERYIETQVLDQQVGISSDGSSADVSAQVLIKGAAGAQTRIWVAIAALDTEGNYVGLRRKEFSTALPSDGVIQINEKVYSVAGKIDQVVVQIEAINIQ